MFLLYMQPQTRCRKIGRLGTATTFGKISVNLQVLESMTGVWFPIKPQFFSGSFSTSVFSPLSSRMPTLKDVEPLKPQLSSELTSLNICKQPDKMSGHPKTWRDKTCFLTKRCPLTSVYFKPCIWPNYSALSKSEPKNSDGIDIVLSELYTIH